MGKLSRIYFLGTGPAEPVEGRGKNRRLSSSVVIGWGDKRILVDVTPFVLEQLEKVGLERQDIDLVLLSHAHSDAIGGLPDLHEFLVANDIPVYAERRTKKTVIENFSSLDDLNWEFFTANYRRDINGAIRPIRVRHALQETRRYPTVGFRFGDELVYAEDILEIPRSSEKYFRDVDIAVIDGAAWFGSPAIGHWPLEEALEHLLRWNPGEIYIIQAGRTYPTYSKAQEELERRWEELGGKSSITLSYDGLIVEPDDQSRNELLEALADLPEQDAIAIYDFLNRFGHDRIIEVLRLVREVEKFETDDEPIEVIGDWRITGRDKRRAYRKFRQWLRRSRLSKYQGLIDAETV